MATTPSFKLASSCSYRHGCWLVTARLARKEKKGHNAFHCKNLPFYLERKKIFSAGECLNSNGQNYFASYTQLENGQKKRVFTFSHSTVEKSKVEASLVSVINEPNMSVLYNDCSQSVLKRNLWVSFFPKSIYKALQYLI